MTQTLDPTHQVIGSYLEYAVMFTDQQQTMVEDFGMDREAAECAHREMAAMGTANAKVVARSITVAYGPWEPVAGEVMHGNTA
ncbi:hypothetical protein FE391_00235 [Nonomuraea sp. KC401]|uniref:Uncharacterized protein n=1 Tax=Nonomuraea longispora TaxID=1848320 RepID=A0A4R4NQG5_9ACTN|nr:MULTISPECIES: hypothetical protein [Nonomuraea]NBE91762.1 hypothetical protein [Nonomuraea sp. K271]TDC10067.1 hypothetical protein E1267_05450 [Nonomuraea longispora]TLF86367.1 hypothetical protein FE391_00235 [Nonomuraea sp. KC401]